MSVRLFHRRARFVASLRGGDGGHRWIALHLRPIAWDRIFAPALTLVGLRATAASDRLQFGDGSLRWTGGAFWTTIRLQLPACSAKKAALLAAGLLKAARYADESGG